MRLLVAFKITCGLAIHNIVVELKIIWVKAAFILTKDRSAPSVPT